MIGSRRKQPYPVLRLATALATFVFVALVGFDALTSGLVPFIGSSAPGVTAIEQPAMAPEMALAPAEDASERNVEVEPEIESETPAEMEVPPEPTMRAGVPPAEGTDQIGEFLDQEGVEGESTPKYPPKWKSVDAPELVPDGELPVPLDDIEREIPDQADRIPDRPSGILAWPIWLIALRGAEITIGGAVVVLVVFMIRARRR
jgi:hypothetical protein